MEPLITTEDKLKERIKELNCLYEVSSIIANCDYNNISHCLKEIAICLKNSLLYNNQAYIEIKTKDFIVTSDSLPKKIVSISSPIYVFNKEEGVLKAGYDNKLFEESDFLIEEKPLLTKVGIEIGNLLERKKNKENEALMERKVQRVDRISILGEISAGIAHELNTPLANILGFAELLKSRFKADTKVVDDIDKIINSAIFSREVVKKLMFFACEMPQQMAVVNINEVITDAMTLLNPTFKKHSINWTLKFSNPAIKFKADSIQITQVIFNLVLNAIYFSQPEGKIHVDVSYNKKGLSICIYDEGSGIKSSISEKIFNPFYTTKPVGDGAGLGLSVVHGIIKSHKGTISHKPNNPKGTIFMVNLPNL